MLVPHIHPPPPAPPLSLSLRSPPRPAAGTYFNSFPPAHRGARPPRGPTRPAPPGARGLHGERRAWAERWARVRGIHRLGGSEGGAGVPGPKPAPSGPLQFGAAGRAGGGIRTPGAPRPSGRPGGRRSPQAGGAGRSRTPAAPSPPLRTRRGPRLRPRMERRRPSRRRHCCQGNRGGGAGGRAGDETFEKGGFGGCQRLGTRMGVGGGGGGLFKLSLLTRRWKDWFCSLVHSTNFHYSAGAGLGARPRHGASAALEPSPALTGCWVRLGGHTSRDYRCHC